MRICNTGHSSDHNFHAEFLLELSHIIPLKHSFLVWLVLKSGFKLVVLVKVTLWLPATLDHDAAATRDLQGAHIKVARWSHVCKVVLRNSVTSIYRNANNVASSGTNILNDCCWLVLHGGHQFEIVDLRQGANTNRSLGFLEQDMGVQTLEMLEVGHAAEA